MAGTNTVVEEEVKYRDGKKWKSRWCVLRKPSPVADCLHVKLYKCVKDALKGVHPKHEFYLEEFFGLETRFSLDKEDHVLAIICQKQITIFSFGNRDTLIKFEVKLRNALGEDHQFPVVVKIVPTQSKLPLQRMRMHIHGQRFCLTSHYPPKLQASWTISELRSFGRSENRFIFNGSAKQGKQAEGLHVLESNQAEEIEEIIQCVSLGKSSNSLQKNKRRSQNLDYLDPVSSSSSSYSVSKGSLPSSPITYRHAEWRHSFSMSNRHWSLGHSSQLVSIENVERDKLRALYDVPPSPTRRVEGFKPKKPTETSSTVHSPSSPAQKISGNSGCPQGNWTLPGTWTNDLQSLQQLELARMACVSTSAPALCGYGAYALFSEDSRNISTSVPNSIDEMDELDHREAMESLQREKTDLHMEISMLDDMIQGCRRNKRNNSAKEKHKPPPVPHKKKSRQNSHRLGNLSLPNSPPQNHKHYQQPESLLSPNLFCKLQNIPSRSKMSAPLPYVNLEKYDLGDVDDGHVDLPRSAAAACADSGNWSAPCTTSGSARLSHSGGYEGNKENIHTSQSTCNCASMGSCSASHHKHHRSLPVAHPQTSRGASSVSSVSKKENIYVNEFPLRKRSPSPPAIPPKGPALQKLRGRRVHDNQMPPPVPPHQRRKSSSSQALGTRDQKLDYQVTGTSSPASLSDSYLLMSDFQRGDEEDEGGGESLDITPVHDRQSVMPRKPSQNLGAGDHYMEMGSIFESEEKFLENQRKKAEEKSLAKSIVTPPSFRKLNVKAQACKPPVIREENYLLMTHLKPEDEMNYIRTDESVESSPDLSQQRRHMSVDLLNQGSSSTISDNNSSGSTTGEPGEVPKPSLVLAPFTNLINFQQHDQPKCRSPGGTSLSLSSSTSSLQTSITPSKSIKGGTGSQSNTDKSGADNSSTKAPSGFFNKLIRRNSGNRKSMSQSQENLLGSSSSESCLDRSAYQAGVREAQVSRAVSQSSDSSNSSAPQPHLPPLSGKEEEMENDGGMERQRSCSMPNQTSFVQVITKDINSPQEGLRDSIFSALSLDDQLQLLESEQDTEISDSSSLNDSFKGKPCYTGPCESTGSENGEEDHEKLSTTRKLQLLSSVKKKDANVYMVYHATGMSRKGSDSSSKTDDEKLIELLKASSKIYSLQGSDESCNSLSDEVKRDCKRRYSLPNETHTKSPKEEASEIAKHVTSLAPFVPPKMKTYLSCPLSPVPESSQTREISSAEKLRNVSCGAMFMKASKESQVRAVLSPAMEKERAKSSLRILAVGPSEEEEEIWIPRQPPNSRAGSEEKTEDPFQALVVEVDDNYEQTDRISLSSLESVTTSVEEGGASRSSPASTLLRPRSGKEYKMVERRKTANDSLNSSPAQTPKSLSGALVFSFDNAVSPSQGSLLRSDHDLHSRPPSSTRLARADSSLSGRLSERITPPRTYVNVDMTPPSSPHHAIFPSTAEQEPQLNYAEIDLSSTTVSNRSRSLKGRKPSLRSLKQVSQIEYAMIDMEATQAIRRAGQEHAISRSDSNSLRRSMNAGPVLPPREPKGSISESETTSSVVCSPPTITEERAEQFRTEDTLLPERRGSTSSSSSSEVIRDTSSDEDDDDDFKA